MGRLLRSLPVHAGRVFVQLLSLHSELISLKSGAYRARLVPSLAGSDRSGVSFYASARPMTDVFVGRFVCKILRVTMAVRSYRRLWVLAELQMRRASSRSVSLMSFGRSCHVAAMFCNLAGSLRARPCRSCGAAAAGCRVASRAGRVTDLGGSARPATPTSLMERRSRRHCRHRRPGGMP